MLQVHDVIRMSKQPYAGWWLLKLFSVHMQLTLLSLQDWLKTYSRRRYGKTVHQVEAAWEILHHTIYNCTDGIAVSFSIKLIPCLYDFYFLRNIILEHRSNYERDASLCCPWEWLSQVFWYFYGFTQTENGGERGSHAFFHLLVTGETLFCPHVILHCFT